MDKSKIKFIEITLPSVDEVRGLGQNVLAADEPWYLRTPGSEKDRVAIIDSDGCIDEDGENVDCSWYCEEDNEYVLDECPVIRPMLRAANPKKIDIEEEDVVTFHDTEWIYLGNGLFLSYEPIGQQPFRMLAFGETPEDANVYEKSDVKRFVEEWAEAAGFKFQLEASKVKTSFEPVDMDFSEITILSGGEAKLLSKRILHCTDSWWLRSSGEIQMDAQYVNKNGIIINYGGSVELERGVRPALRMANPKASDLRIGDKIRVAGKSWTRITYDGLILCDEIVGETHFNPNERARDANKYSGSELEKWLKNWAAENDIIFAAPKFYDITLLSAWDAVKLDKNILATGDWWWLKTPVSSSKAVTFVAYDGSIMLNGSDDTNFVFGVRPVLEVANAESKNLKKGDKFHIANRAWTMISEKLALCDNAVGKCPFCSDLYARSTNVYEASDVKKWLHNWASENKIEFISKPYPDFEGITLLSKDEAEQVKKNTLSCGKNWWLRSSGDDVACVSAKGYILSGMSVHESAGIRPALRIAHPESSGIKVGDELHVADKTWTVVTDNLALCNDIIAYDVFCRWYQPDANFESSNIKNWLEKWALINDIRFCK